MCCSSFNRISQTPREFKSHPSNTTLKHRYVLQMSKMYARHWKRWKVSCLTDVRFVWTWQPQDAEEEEGEVVVIVCAVRVLVRSLEMVDTSDFKCCPMCLLCFFFCSLFQSHYFVFVFDLPNMCYGKNKGLALGSQQQQHAFGLAFDIQVKMQNKMHVLLFLY